MTTNIFGYYIHIFEIPVIVFLLASLLNDVFKNGTKINVVNRNAYSLYLILSILFLISIFLSSINAIRLSLVFKSFFKWFEIFTISLLVFFYVRDKKRFKTVYWLIFFSTTLTLLVVIIKMAGGDYDIILNRKFPAYDSLYALVLILPFTIFNKKLKYYIITLVLLFSAIVSLSRGVWIGILISFVYIFKFLNKKFFLKFTALSFVVVVLLFIVVAPLETMIIGRFEEILSTTSVSNVERLALINYAFLGFSDSPILGVGALNFPHFMLSEGLISGLVAEDLTILEPHNFFLQTLTEEGLFGFLVICCFFINIYIILFKNLQKDPVGLYILGLRALFLCIMISLVLGFVANEFRFNLALFLGLVLSLTRINTANLFLNSNENCKD